MKTVAVLAALVFASPFIASSTAYAAHAGAPYKNVNKKNDAGNDTGDAKVDALNKAQLNQNYQGQNPGDKGQAMTPMSPH